MIYTVINFNYICVPIFHYRRISGCSKLLIFGLPIVILFTVSTYAQKFIKITFTCFWWILLNKRKVQLNVGFFSYRLFLQDSWLKVLLSDMTKYLQISKYTFCLKNFQWQETHSTQVCLLFERFWIHLGVFFS